MAGYFDPLPEGELDLDKIKQWVQNNTDTFRRSIAMQGTLFSSDFVDGTTGWRLNPDGTAQFNEDVDIGGASTTNAQLFIHNTLQHINLLENDGTDYPNHQFIIDVQNDQGRFLWRDSSGAPVSTDAVRISQNGQWDFVTGPVLYPDGAAATPSITFRATGQQDVGFYRSGTDEISVALGGAQESVFTADGMRGLIADGDGEVQDVNGFTNTSYADLDALTTAAFSNPVAVTVNTGTRAIINISTTAMNINTSGSCFLAYRVSGATTTASSDALAARSDVTGRSGVSHTHLLTGLTPGANTFELQARVTANNGRITNPRLTVIAL